MILQNDSLEKFNVELNNSKICSYPIHCALGHSFLSCKFCWINVNFYYRNVLLLYWPSFHLCPCGIFLFFAFPSFLINFVKVKRNQNECDVNRKIIKIQKTTTIFVSLVPPSSFVNCCPHLEFSARILLITVTHFQLDNENVICIFTMVVDFFLFFLSANTRSFFVCFCLCFPFKCQQQVTSDRTI